MTDCVLWTGSTTDKGYGVLWLARQRYRAHRAFYMLYNGPIPRGCEIHHTCKNRLCVNPRHLVAMPHGEHVSSLHRAGQEFCKYGHALTPENTERQALTNNKRRCIICRRRRDNMRNARFRKVPA